jgi:hypothetical protein
LAVVEVVIRLECLQAVDELLVGVVFAFQVVQVAVIVQDYQIDLFQEILVYAWYFLQEVHDDLNVLDLFP